MNYGWCEENTSPSPAMLMALRYDAGATQSITFMLMKNPTAQRTTEAAATNMAISNMSANMFSQNDGNDHIFAALNCNHLDFIQMLPNFIQQAIYHPIEEIIGAHNE